MAMVDGAECGSNGFFSWAIGSVPHLFLIQVYRAVLNGGFNSHRRVNFIERIDSVSYRTFLPCARSSTISGHTKKLTGFENALTGGEQPVQ